MAYDIYTFNRKKDGLEISMPEMERVQVSLNNPLCASVS